MYLTALEKCNSLQLLIYISITIKEDKRRNSLFTKLHDITFYFEYYLNTQ